MGLTEEAQLKVDQACQAAKEFSKLYYETMDKKRHLLAKLYQETAEEIWNGNVHKGKDEILKTLGELPATEHKVESLDCQPIPDSISPGQFTVIVKVYGTVSYTSNNLRSFHQSFILTSQNNVWKIISDTFRFQDKY
ncbi:NTF2-related export protein 2 [Mactra antiquata]